ncbi:MAG TPA: glyoxalase/bleomycin resistance/extradiol dioxygenase family protein [Caulobacter sp.]|nr:glyoxalase/bleomycin resistance/extradiol dioxygenase family protein [Caulobacter sp.]
MTDQLPQLTGVVAYINLEGAAEASDLYQRALGARELVRMPYKDGDPRVMHCCLEINGGHLMLSDFFPEHGFSPVVPQGYTLHLQVPDVDAAWARAVEAGFEVVMPIQLMFWGDRYGQLKDRFGVSWSLATTPKA